MRNSVVMLFIGNKWQPCAGPVPAQAQEFWRGGHVCKRAGSEFVVCCAPWDRYSNGYIGGNPRDLFATGNPTSKRVWGYGDRVAQ